MRVGDWSGRRVSPGLVTPGLNLMSEVSSQSHRQPNLATRQKTTHSRRTGRRYESTTRVGGMVAAGAAVVGLFADPAVAEETTCRGSLGRVTVDNLRVPQRATCTLSGTYVKGAVKVECDATLPASGIRAGWPSTATTSTGTSSARRTRRGPRVGATSCRAKRRTSAPGSDRRLTDRRRSDPWTFRAPLLWRVWPTCSAHNRARMER
jgi:hypothetical protein